MGLTQPQTREIEGHTWVVTPFPGRPANKYKARLLKMIGPALSELLPAIGSLADAVKGKGDVNPDAMIAMLPRVVASLANHVDEDLFVDTQVELMSQSTRDGQQVTPELFDIEFVGNDLELYQALWFILEVNYPDFIGWVRDRIIGPDPQDSPEASPEKKQPSSTTSKG